MIPESVKIGSTNWQVVIDPSLFDRGRRGECEFDRHRILISEHSNDKQREITFIHELLHAIGHMVGITDEKMTDEQFITRIAPFLHTVLTENALTFR